MSNPEHDHRVRRLFDAARELPIADRSAFLDAQCATDAELRQRVWALLAAADDEHFLGSPTFGPVALAAASAAAPAAAVGEGPGTRIGPYVLLQQLGEGGFGAVFLAEQKEPVARHVALKVIKLGMDTRQVVARFEQERQALAVMDHPNIARVLDAGATATGRPYFVMDLVQGVPITDYCDQNSLPIDDRLALFTQVCEAVQHAHQKGIIHRDLKPSNILVGTQDGRAMAKVIDFGIAKATAQKLTDKTLLTAHQQVIGTLQYMSPEQAEGSADIDTRSDVYSLGVLLYELLTGSTPFDTATIRHKMFSEIQRMIREVEPPRPSTRLSESRDTIASIAARRRVEQKRLGRLLRGDLDWIVMRALEKDITRRYATPNDFAQDIRRHLEGEAVVAAPPSTLYRARKFVRRNRGLVAATAAVAASLIAGVVAFAFQARIARKERDTADARAAQLAQVATFQEQMLVQLDATDVGVRLMRDIRGKHSEALPASAVAADEHPRRTESFVQELARVNATDVAVAIVDRTFLAPAVTAVAKQFADQPLVAAALRQTLAKLYAKVGRYDEAESLLRLTLETRQRLLGADHVDALLATNDLADVLDSQGRFTDAEVLHRHAVAGRRQRLGAEHPDTVQSLSELGGNLRYQGKYAEAEPMLREAVDVMRAVRGNDDRSTLICVNTLGYLLIEQGRSVEAEPYWREACETGKRVFGADDPDVIIWTNNYGGVLAALGRQRDAEAYYREAMAASQRVRGLEHPGTATLTQNLGYCLQTQKQHAAAEELARSALAVRRRVLGEDHPETFGSFLHLGAALRDQGKMVEAETHLRTAWTGLTRTLGQEHPDTLRCGRALATFLGKNGQPAEAEALFRELLTTSQSIWGAEHTERLVLMQSLGVLLSQHHRLDEAESMLKEVLAKRRTVSGEDHVETLVVQNALSGVYADQGRLEQAEAEARAATDKARRTLGNQHANTLMFMSDLGQVHLKQQRFADAELLLREAAAGLDKAFGLQHRRTMIARSGLGRSLLGLHRFAEAESELLAAEPTLSATDSVSVEAKQSHAEFLVTLYEAWHATDPAGEHDKAAATWRAKGAALKEAPRKEPVGR